ncbi:MAG: cysteine--tRNA ligase [Chloroflexi bacterium]|nr:cysteine--tRNA ligase [Chloroflexota bacterium]
MTVRLYNTRTRQKEPFTPLAPPMVTLYTCGPTVYRYAHLGNMRTFLMADLLRRTLAYNGYEVRHVKNITDVGHMQDDTFDRGEDKMLLSAAAEGKSPQEIAAYYTDAFRRDEARLHILPAQVFPRASEHIPEMLTIVRRLMDRGYAYQSGDNVYFDVGRFPAYGRLSGNRREHLRAGIHRVELDPNKRNPEDFTLWKGAGPHRTMFWESPWGPGYPGWHIECSAMSMKHLGAQLDLHTGGVDNLFPHHESEIAQSEAATGLPFVRSWLHGEHLMFAGTRMAKSAGNYYTLSDLRARGYDPLGFRYLCLTAHYRSKLNFTWASLTAAQLAYLRLRDAVAHLAGSDPPDPAAWSEGAMALEARFRNAINDDLHLPTALAVVWEVLRGGLPRAEKYALLLAFDRVLGLGLDRVAPAVLPPAVAALLEEREALRRGRCYQEADARRDQVRAAGWEVSDTRQGTQVSPRSRFTPTLVRVSPRHGRPPRIITGARDVPSRLAEPDRCEFSVNLVVSGWLEDVQRCLTSVVRWAGERRVEVVVVQNDADAATAQWLEQAAADDPRLRVLHTTHHLGEGEARNAGLRDSTGTIVLLLDTSAEVTGDIYGPLWAALPAPAVGLVGPRGVRSVDEHLHHFTDHPGPEVDAVLGYCMAFRRAALRRVGLMDERFRFYRNLDLDFSFAFRDQGYRTLALPDLPVVFHEHRGWTSLDPTERDKLSRRNYYRFAKKWGERRDLLVGSHRADQHDGADHDHGHPHDAHDHPERPR